jgi:hypothetical protein
MTRRIIQTSSIFGCLQTIDALRRKPARAQDALRPAFFLDRKTKGVDDAKSDVEEPPPVAMQ